MNPTSMKDFQTLSKLGEGAFSCVFKVKRLSDSTEYALKKVKMSMLTDKEKENALNEVRILASISSPFIIEYKEAFFDETSNSLCVIMEYANGGDIQKKITEKIAAKTTFNEPDLWKAMLQMVKGLKTLHEMQILHRDLKCANIFLSGNGDVKLGDLNVSKVAKKGLVYTQTGTPYYASPEVWRDEPYDMRSDIWSLGCVMYEMAALKPPFRATDMKGLYAKVQKGVYERIPLKFSNELGAIIGKCLQVNPSARPNCDALINEISAFVNASQNFKKIGEGEESKQEQKKQLLQTIKLPKNLKSLQGQLPKANYQKKPSNEMENLYKNNAPISENQPRQRVLSAGPMRDDPQNRQQPLKKPVAENPVVINRNPIMKRPSEGYNNPSNMNNMNINRGIPPQNQRNIANINSGNNQNVLPPRPGLGVPPSNPTNNRAYPVSHNSNNQNIHANQYPVSRSPMHNPKNQIPTPTNNNNPNISNNRGNSARDSSREKLQNQQKMLEEKIANKERNLLGKNANEELLKKYQNIVAGNQAQASNPFLKQQSSGNELKKYYEEKKMEGPKISNVGVKEVPTVSKNTPKSIKSHENLAAGQYLNAGRIAKPSWWG